MACPGNMNKISGSTFWRLLVLLCLAGLSPHAHSQETILQKSYSISFTDYTVGQALDSLAKFSNMYFTYDSRILNEDRKIKLELEQAPLRIILDSLLTESAYYYQLVKKQIIITKDLPDNRELIKVTNSDNSYFRIEGKITDANSGKALPYVNLGIIDKLKGTTSNSEGVFSLTLSKDELLDSLSISFIGYENASLLISEAKDTFVSVALRQTFIPLQEVIVRSNDPLILIQSFLKGIKQNYLESPVNYTAFYRESVQKNRHYMIYLESILDIHTSGYSTTNEARSNARILKNRKIYDVDRLDTVSFRLQGGVEGCMNLDLVKYPAEFLKEENFHFYDYSLVDIQTYNNRPVYVIDCHLKKSTRDIYQQGRIYLDLESLALVKAELYYPEEIAKKITNQIITKRARRLHARPTSLRYQVLYRYQNGHYYFSHALGDLNFRVKSKRTLFSSNFTIKFEMAITEVETKKVHRIPYKERLHPRVVLSEETMEYDPTFWGKENFIQPEEDIRDALRRINPKIQIALPDPPEGN